MLQWGNTAQMGASWARCWLYGPSGGGKTTAAAFFPSPFFVLVYNENSQTTLRGLGRMLGTSFNYVVIGAPQQNVASALAQVQSDFEQLCNVLLEAAASGTLTQRFGESIVLDNMTHYNDLVVSEIAGGSSRKKMEKQEWGVLRNHYLHVRDVLWRLPAHIVFTSLASARTDASNTLVAAGPSVQGAGGELLPSSCDALGYCDTDLQGQRVVHFKQQGRFPARHRYPGMTDGPIPTHQLWPTMAPFLGH